ncbi:MAG: DUF4422 domain-containing protein [Rikenellaceae bacterium]
MKSQILLCYHSQCELPKGDLYRAIFAGRKLSGEDAAANAEGDDTGDNISDKNRSFCELTAQYWAWKNGLDADYIGLCHYRRFFDFKGNGGVATMSGAMERLSSFTQEDVERTMEGFDVALMREHNTKYSMRKLYEHQHIGGDLTILRNVLSDIEPDYVAMYDEYMAGRRLVCCNMFIMSNELFNRYSEWLFKVLFELERRIDVSGRDDYQSRVFGFLAERLLGVYCSHNELKICYVPVVKIAAEGEVRVETKRYVLFGVIQYFKKRVWYSEAGDVVRRKYYIFGVPVWRC